MAKKLIVLILIVVLIYLPLFSQKSNIAKKGCGLLKSKLTIKTVSLDKNGKKYEKPIPKKNYDTFDYDEAGRITRIISKDKGETKITYNEYGRLQHINRSNIEFEHYYYDKLGRNTRIEYKSKGKMDPVEFKYSTTEASFKLGNMVEKIEKNEHSFFRYSGNRLVEEKKVIHGHTFSLKYKYNKKGKLKELRYPSGLIVSFSYDEKNKITKVSLVKNKIKKTTVANYNRGEDSISIEYGNGLTTLIDVNNVDRSVSMKTGDIQDSEYKFNGKGFIEKVIDKKDRRDNKEFYYDQHGHLITAYGPWGKYSYRYDKMDNLVSRKGKGENSKIDYDLKSGKIKKLSKNGENITVHYDRLGRMFQYGEMTFGYNARGRLAEIIKDNGAKVELYYNYKNQRVAEKSKDKEYYYVYDKDDRMLAKYDDKGNALVEYIYSKELPAALIKNNNVYYYHHDLMSFPVMVSDKSGKIVRRAQSRPYGEIISTDGEIDDELRFPGQYEIKGTDLYYNLNRTYIPMLGRYLEPDPMPVRENLYQYTSGNPIMFVDYKGLNTYYGIVTMIDLSIKIWFIAVIKLLAMFGPVESECFKNKQTGYSNKIFGTFYALMGGGGFDLCTFLKKPISITFSMNVFTSPFSPPPEIWYEFTGTASLVISTIIKGGGYNTYTLKLGDVVSRGQADVAFGTSSLEAFFAIGVSKGKTEGCTCCKK